MSMLKEYEENEKARLIEAEKSTKHYLTANAPGTRTFEKQTDAVRARIEAMKKEKAKPNHTK
ncbi:MAG: hypothetical protein AAF242_14010 [Bacteroidota bacterium]